MSIPQDSSLRSRVLERLNGKTKPQGSLGRLEELALKMALIQNSESPVVNQPVVVVMAGDHGLAINHPEVSAFPYCVTNQMVKNFLAGGAAINVLSRTFDAEFLVVDVGVVGSLPSDGRLIRARVAQGTYNCMVESAMTPKQYQAALKAGVDSITRVCAAGGDLICLGEMGIGNTSSGALLMHRLTGLPLNECAGAGAGLSPEGVRVKLRVLNEVMNRVAPKSVEESLIEFGGFEIVALIGAMLECVSRGVAFVVDGFIVSVAFAYACDVEPKTCHFGIVSHVSEEQGHAKLLELLEVKPLFSLGLRLGEASGAVLVVPLIKASLAVLNEMSSFEEAQVSGSIGSFL